MIKKALLILAFWTIFFLAPSAHAAQTAPYKLNFQGRLADSNGNLMATGSYNIKFRLMSASSGGSNLWEADRIYTGSGTGDHRVQITNGMFNIQLGDTSTGVGDPALSPSLFNTQTNPTIYLEIELPTPATATCATVSCATFTEGAMTPRQLISAAPYAMNADTVDGIDGASIAQLGGTNTFTGNQTFTGTFLDQPASDSTTAFQIKNNSGAVLLVADTTNLDLKVGGGDVSPDGNPALLVLDYKNTSGDPATGVNGALYYNSNLGRFRCYEESIWKDCISKARTRFEFHTDFTSNISYGNGTVIDPVFASGLANGTFSFIASTANHPGILRMAMSSSSGIMVVASTYDTTMPVLFGAGTWNLTTQVRLGSLSNNTDTYTSYNGFYDQPSTSPPTNGCYVKYTHSNNSGKWQGVCRKASVESTCDTGVTAVAGTWYDLRTSVNAAATVATFTVNGSSCTVSTNIPTAGVTFGVSDFKTAGSTNVNIDYDGIEIIGDGLNR